MRYQPKFLGNSNSRFIGSHLIEEFLSKDNEVICLDNFDDYYDPQIKIKTWNLFKRLKISSSLKEIRIRHSCIIAEIKDIFHEAAQTGSRMSIKDPIKPHEINATNI
jgi:UDP-glucose 4-epimerase